MSRQLPDLLEAYLEFTKNTESPISYHTWAGLGLISSCLERKVWMQWGHTRIFPNQYIILVGPAGARKGEPIVIAQDFMRDLGLTLSAEKTTEEALSKLLAESVRNFDYGGAIEMQCPLTVISEEMAVFLGMGNTKFLATLTNWYDSRGTWEYRTKHVGVDEISGVCVNILGSMAPDWIPLAIPPQAIGGGFTSRVIWIVEHKKGRDIPDPNEIGVDDKLRQQILHDLDIVHNMLIGEFRFDDTALAVYKEWYLKEESKNKAGRPSVSDPRLAGYVNRRATHVKKISIAISASRSNALIITKQDLIRALRLMEAVESMMGDVFGRVGMSVYSEQTHNIMEFIRGKSVCRRRDVMQVFYRDVDGKSLEIIEATMRATRLIEIKLTPEGENEYHWIG